MKITLRQLEAVCSVLNNGMLRDSWFGLFAERVGVQQIRIRLQARKFDALVSNSTAFTGTTKECAAFLKGMEFCLFCNRGGSNGTKPQ